MGAHRLDLDMYAPRATRLAATSQPHDVLELGECIRVLNTSRVEELYPHGVREADLRLQQQRLVRLAQRVVHDENAAFACAAVHRLRTQPREHEIDHHRGGEQLAARDRNSVDRHVLGVALALGLEQPDAQRASAERRRHALDQIGSDVPGQIPGPGEPPPEWSRSYAGSPGVVRPLHV